MPAPALLVAVLALALAGACPRASACSSFMVDCGDGAVVHARTVDFEVGALLLDGLPLAAVRLQARRHAAQGCAAPAPAPPLAPPSHPTLPCGVWPIARWTWSPG